jgi:hypothetical protein
MPVEDLIEPDSVWDGSVRNVRPLCVPRLAAPAHALCLRILKDKLCAQVIFHVVHRRALFGRNHVVSPRVSRVGCNCARGGRAGTQCRKRERARGGGQGLTRILRMAFETTHTFTPCASTSSSNFSFSCDWGDRPNEAGEKSCWTAVTESVSGCVGRRGGWVKEGQARPCVRWHTRGGTRFPNTLVSALIFSALSARGSRRVSTRVKQDHAQVYHSTEMRRLSIAVPSARVLTTEDMRVRVRARAPDSRPCIAALSHIEPLHEPGIVAIVSPT